MIYELEALALIRHGIHENEYNSCVFSIRNSELINETKSQNPKLVIAFFEVSCLFFFSTSIFFDANWF